MDASDIPYKFAQPWAASATSGFITNPIPPTTALSAAASQALGFPPATSVAIGAGGTPPNIADENGMGYYCTVWLQWFQAGGAVPYDSTFQTNIGGYPNGAVVESAVTPGLLWQSTVDDNMTNPDASGAGWIVFQALQIQTQAGNYAVDGGTANALSVTLNPAPPSLVSLIGVPIRVKKSASTNSSLNVTLAVNGLTATALVNPDGSLPVVGGLPANGIFEAIYDGTHFQIIGGAAVPQTSPFCCQPMPGWLGLFGNGAYYPFLIPGTYSWVAPITGSARVRAWGGGGGAGSGSAGPGGGGAGGGFALGVISVTQGTSYTVIVGAGGPGSSGTGNGTAGGNSSFQSTSILLASGGGPGTQLGVGGTGGNGSGTGTSFVASGGSGGSGVSGSGGGGGGGAGSQLGNGGNGGSSASGNGGGGGGAVGGYAGGAGLASDVGAGGASPFAAPVGSNGGLNIIGIVNTPSANSLNLVVRFPFDGFYGGGGEGDSSTVQNGGLGAGGGGAGSSGTCGIGGVGGGGGGAPNAVSIPGGAGGPGGGGGAGVAAQVGGSGGAGGVIIEM